MEIHANKLDLNFYLRDIFCCRGGGILRDWHRTSLPIHLQRISQVESWWLQCWSYWKWRFWTIVVTFFHFQGWFRVPGILRHHELGQPWYFKQTKVKWNISTSQKAPPTWSLDLFAEQMFISGLYLTCWSMYDCPWWPPNCSRVMSTTAQTSHWRFKNSPTVDFFLFLWF